MFALAFRITIFSKIMKEPQITPKRRILNLLAGITGNTFCQKILDKNLKLTRFLTGIDSGTWVETSGEYAAVKMALVRAMHKCCIFDVGANEGQFIRVIKKYSSVQKKIEIHSFEASSYTYGQLREALANENNIILNNLAVADKPGELTLYSDVPGSGRASLTQRNLGHQGVSFSNKESVKVTTIDDYCRQNNVDHIDLLKIDVEGHELDVLKGAAKMLGEGKIAIVCFEFSSCNVDTRVFMRDFFQLFTPLKYSLYRITASGFLRAMPLYSEIYEQFGDSNYIALKK